jgi:hypothetical protein
VLPGGFVRIRHYGFLANRSRSRLVTIARQLLDVMSLAPSAPAQPPQGIWACPKCAAPMIVIERFTPSDIRLRTVRRGTYVDTS